MLERINQPHPLSPKGPDTDDTRAQRDLDNEAERDKARKSSGWSPSSPELGELRSHHLP